MPQVVSSSPPSSADSALVVMGAVSGDQAEGESGAQSDSPRQSPVPPEEVDAWVEEGVLGEESSSA